MTGSAAKVQLENEHIRVTRWDLPKGANTGMHVHKYHYVVVPLAAGEMSVTASGEEQSFSNLTAGDSYFRPAGAEHTVTNVGNDVLSFVEVEIMSSVE